MPKAKITYTMKVTNLQQAGDDSGTVTMASFTVEGNDGDHVASVSYSVNLLPPAKGAPFVALEDVTQEQAVEWTTAALEAPGKIGIKGVQEEIYALLMAQKKPQAKPVALPWL